MQTWLMDPVVTGQCLTLKIDNVLKCIYWLLLYKRKYLMHMWWQDRLVRTGFFSVVRQNLMSSFTTCDCTNMWETDLYNW